MNTVDDPSLGEALDMIEKSSVYQKPEKLHLFNEFPQEIKQLIVFFLTQDDLLTLCSTSRQFYHLAINVLYRKIYLNDSHIEQSDVYSLATTWSRLKLKPAVSENDARKQDANSKLKYLLRTFQENLGLCDLVNEIRLNWDLEINLQRELIYTLSDHSRSLRTIENVTDPCLNEALEITRFKHNLISLDLPPPYPLPGGTYPDAQYIPNMKRFLSSKVDDGLKYLTIFMDPLYLFNNVHRLTKKLEIESLKLHCRGDIYPLPLHRKFNWKFHKLSEIFDVKYLKVLTIISWYDHDCPENVYKFDQWKDFHNIEDLTLIAVTNFDEKIATLVSNCKTLKRLKLDFAAPIKDIDRFSRIYGAIFKHNLTLSFLDIKLGLSYDIFHLDLRSNRVAFKIPCNCPHCQQRVLKDIIQKKLYPLGADAADENTEYFWKTHFFDQFFASSLSPYSKAVDRYPSVKTGPDDVESFINRFNELNHERKYFKPLTVQDFYDLYYCLLHSMKEDLEPFIQKFPNLKFLVVNDISFLIKKNERGLRYPFPLFYGENFKTNFHTNYNEPRRIVRTLY